MNQEIILRQAKQIMDEFAQSLSALEMDEEYGLERQSQLRDPSSHDFPGFRERAFRNAKRKNDDYFIMNKKGW